MARRVRDPSPRRRNAALARYRLWRAQYADARRRRQSGETDVGFPYGTYWMARFAGAKVANAPP